jgi:hypothetical protein
VLPDSWVGKAADVARVALRERRVERRVELGIAVGVGQLRLLATRVLAQRRAQRAARLDPVGVLGDHAAQPRQRLFEVPLAESPAGRGEALGERRRRRRLERWTPAESAASSSASAAALG